MQASLTRLGMRDTYLRVGHGFLLVFSVTSLSSLNFTRELHSKILQVKEVWIRAHRACSFRS